MLVSGWVVSRDEGIFVIRKFGFNVHGHLLCKQKLHMIGATYELLTPPSLFSEFVNHKA